MEEFQQRVTKAIGAIINDRREIVIEELRRIKDLINTDDKLEEINTDFLENYILENPKIKKIDIILKTIIEGLGEQT